MAFNNKVASGLMLAAYALLAAGYFLLSLDHLGLKLGPFLSTS